MKKISTIIPVLVLIIATALMTRQYYLDQGSTLIEIKNNFENLKTEGEQLRYLRDDLTLSGEDLAGNDFLLKVGLNRKEIEPSKFIHYYSARLFYLGKSHIIYSSNFIDPSPYPQTNQFLKSFTNELTDDLSTKETYSFNITIDEEEIRAEINGLVGDFITKNRLEYTRYLSIGTAEVTLNNQSFQTNAMIEKSYSSDHSKYLFFDGYDEMSSRTYKFELWDEENNFYLIDDSVVSEDHPAYRPHTWVLYKDTKGNYTKRAFSAEIEFQEDELAKSWQISVPKLDFDFDLATNYNRKETWYGGPISGAVNGEKVKGFFSYKSE